MSWLRIDALLLVGEDEMQNRRLPEAGPERIAATTSALVVASHTAS